MHALFAASIRQKQQPLVPYTTIDTNSVSSSNMASPLWGAIAALAANSGTVDLANPADTRGDMPAQSFYVNRAANAAAFGFVAAIIRTPPNDGLGNDAGTAYTISFDAELPAGIGAGTLAYSITDTAGAAFLTAGGVPASAVLSAARQTFSAPVVLARDTEYRLCILCNYPTYSTAQCRAIVAALRLVPTAGTGLFADFQRIDMPGQTYEKGGTPVLLTNSERALRYGALATMRIHAPGVSQVIIEGVDTASPDGFPQLSQWSVWQSGVFLATFQPTKNGNIEFGTVTGITAAQVEVVGGGLISNATWGANTSLSGSTIRAVYVPGQIAARVAAPSRQLVALGDSIWNAAGSTNASRFAYAQLLRETLYPVAINVEAWSGLTLYVDALDAPARAATVAVLAQYGAGNVVWFEPQTNDYLQAGNSPWNAAAYGVGEAALMDAKHAADPTSTIVVQTAFRRLNEATPNPLGNILADYRAAAAAAQAARPAFSLLCDAPVSLLTTVPAGDGVHPNNAENATIAANMYSWLRLNGVF